MILFAYCTNEDEMFFVIEGSIKLTVAGVERVISDGESALVRRGTPHTFKTLSSSLRSLAILTPAGFEEFFRALAGDPPRSYEQIAQAATRYGSRLIL